MMEERKKTGKGRGLGFALDAIYAIAIVAVFALSVAPLASLQHGQDNAAQIAGEKSLDMLRAACTATAAELSPASQTIAQMVFDGNITQSESNRLTLCQLVARLAKRGDAQSLSLARDSVGESLGPLFGQQTGLSLYADGTLVYNSSREADSGTVHASKAYVYSYATGEPYDNPLGPVEIQVRVFLMQG